MALKFWLDLNVCDFCPEFSSILSYYHLPPPLHFVMSCRKVPIGYYLAHGLLTLY